MDAVDEAIKSLSATGMETHEVWPAYSTDLGLEGLLLCFDATGDPRYLRHVEKVWDFRGLPSRSLTVGNSYFTCLHYETYMRTGDPKYVDGLVDLALDWQKLGPRDARGALGHRGTPRGAVFVDLLAGLAPLLARAGAVSGREEFFVESLHQIDLFHDALCDPKTGLWHHARNWHGEGSLAPVGWARGCGWVLRALEKTLLAVPEGFPGRSRAMGYFTELIRVLLLHQNERGVWTQLVHRSDAFDEASGTGLILAAIAGRVFRNAGPMAVPPSADGSLQRGLEGLLGFLGDQGRVAGGCPECPPLRTEEEYLLLTPRAGDPHAQAAALLALAAARLGCGRGDS